MLKLERDIAYGIMEENIERSEQEILKEGDEEQMIEKSDLTALGVAVPEVLVTEEDDIAESMPVFGRRTTQETRNEVGDGNENGEDDGMAQTYKSHSLVEFMEFEDQIKQGTFNERGNVFVGDTFRDEMAESVKTELTEMVTGSGKRNDESILREEEERQSFQRKHGLMNQNLFGESMQSKEMQSEQQNKMRAAKGWDNLTPDQLKQMQQTMPKDSQTQDAISRKEKLLVEMELKSQLN